MNTHFARPLEKEPPPRPPLITPSASPPVSRISQRRDRPPAAKRPRLSATPSHSSSTRAGSSTSNAVDVDAQRLESRDRLMRTWEQLAERYYKPLEEDDIVDLRELKFLKDRGVTRGAERAYAIGSLAVPAEVESVADADADDATSQGADEENGGEEDESADELDLLSDAPIPPVPENYKTWYVPPADATNAEDAEAFREFEEAERKWRALSGADEKEDEDGLPEHSPQEDEKDEDVLPEVVDAPSSSSRPHEPVSQRRKSRAPSRPSGDDSSEDELAAWVIDDAPATTRHPTPPDEDVIDLTESRSPSPSSPRGRSRSRPRRVPSPATSRARSRSKARATEAKRPQTPEPEPQRATSPEEVLQLLTPPRSSSAAESVPEDNEPPPPAAETPSPKFPKPRARYTPRPRTPSDDEEDISSTNDAMPPPLEPLRVGPPKKPKKQRSIKGLTAEVVISVPRKKLNGATVVRASLPDPLPSPVIAASKRKSGKSKENAAASARPSTPESVHRRRRSHSQPRPSTARESNSPQPLPPSKGRKRRRVSSLSSLSDSPPPNTMTTEAAPDALNQKHKQRLLRSGSKSGYSSEPPPPSSSPVHSDEEHGALRRTLDSSQGTKVDVAEADTRRAGPSQPRMGSLAPPMPPFPYPPPMFPPYTPQHHDHGAASSRREHASQRQTSYPPSLQDPQAQFMFAHAWHLSYLMASGAIPTPPLPNPGYPSGLPPWPPYTPSHQRHRTHPTHGFDTPSSDAGPSRSSMYSTPTHHPHPYPYSYDPGFSNGTLPPSSPISSPALSSPILRPASVPPGQRSRSRGRRVSFKLDDNDRPLPPTPPRRPATLESESASNGGARRASASASSKGKGKARADPGPQCEEEESSSDDEPPPGPPRGRASQRARTPGPPSQREQSVPSTSAAQKKSKQTPKAAKRRD